MLSVAVHKDIGEYEPKIVGKLTLRTLGCIAAACGVSVLSGLYITFVLGLDISDWSMICVILSIPFWAMGFWRPNGLKFEVFARYWVEYNFTDKKVFYKPSFVKSGLLEDAVFRKETIKYDKPTRKYAEQPGIESYSPRAGRVL